MSEIKFDQALARLEKIVEEMEGEEMPLEASLKKYEEGVKLARLCLEKLEKAEKRIEILQRSADGSLSAEPFKRKKKT